MATTVPLTSRDRRLRVGSWPASVRRTLEASRTALEREWWRVSMGTLEHDCAISNQGGRAAARWGAGVECGWRCGWMGPTRGTCDLPLQVAFARGAWPSPSSSFPRRWCGFHGDPPPRTWFQQGPASSLYVPVAAHPSSPSIAVGVLPPLAPRPRGDRREREGPTDGHGSDAFASARHRVPLLHIQSQEPKKASGCCGQVAGPAA
jgi:hypothetical protein